MRSERRVLPFAAAAWVLGAAVPVGAERPVWEQAVHNGEIARQCLMRSRDYVRGWLAHAEDLQRGWYAGPIGFVDAAAGGEFVVALRSALLAGDAARLFAGAGIVAGSLPDSELRETRLKLRALLSPLLEI